MYAARVAEKAPVSELFEHPLHPYTWGLLGSLPRLESDIDRLVQIPGTPPSLLSPPRGCRFNPRCPYVFDRCREELPDLRAGVVGEGHSFRCHLADEDRARIWDAKKAALDAAEGSAA
jgi:peptide/nickel transport system ATP-binding protein